LAGYVAGKSAEAYDKVARSDNLSHPHIDLHRSKSRIDGTSYEEDNQDVEKRSQKLSHSSERVWRADSFPTRPAG
jgi:hypothetical protein